MTKYTHKGWFGICPIYIANMHSECPQLIERSFIFWPLLFISEAGFRLLMVMHSLVDPDYIPAWPVLITGEIKNDSGSISK